MKYEYMAEATKAANAEAIAENLGLENADNILNTLLPKNSGICPKDFTLHRLG